MPSKLSPESVSFTLFLMVPSLAYFDDDPGHAGNYYIFAL
jgi:Fe-S-cluster formation regulator IscX/YfhJ